ncbi:hypothetical protein KX928_17595 [Roseobacter sp. YSTF-M11]|uniref:Uncharacterized protein n=1 Tax=Roseobacter insulae TaxID=2859783 RepID=A0A9X1K1U7_9RHOB|nr:hypothetical protein [Roseobacter insulae]MBW4709604.1 hypothetical protein [Roseobacter insulae]
MRKVLIFMFSVSFFLIFLIVAGLTLTRNTADRVAYFKTPERNRLLIYTAPIPDDPGDARAILDRAPWTEGQLTAAYLYAPADAEAARLSLTAAPASFLAASDAVETAAPAFSCRLTIAPTGSKVWAGDCSGG